MAEITGRHVAVFTVGAFGIIIAVNLVMAWKAVSTFPGLEVSNSYVASQEFDTRRAAQEALGWTLDASYDQGRARVAFADAQGNPVRVDTLSVLIGRTTEAREDVTPDFAYAGDAYEARVALHPGYWMFKVTARALDGTLYEKRVDLLVKG
jgi:nitrogen fixation protein FixH